MEKFAAHTLLSHSEVKNYLIDTLQLFEENTPLIIEEIGDGNINYVFKATDSAAEKSIIVKQSDTLLRSSGRPLDISRNKIEADILKLYHQLVPTYVPEVYAYDEKLALIVMEDISACKNLRHELMVEQTFPTFAEDISTFLVTTLLSTTDLCWDKKEKKQMVKAFTNIDMCDISEDLVFTEPYNNYKNRNVIIEDNQEFVETHIYNNQALIGEVAQLRSNFMNNAQALLHGDLHSGSIFVSQSAMKVIDPEFAFYGPMGYDIGNVIGNLFFPLARAANYSANEAFSQWLTDTIETIYDLVESKLTLAYDQKVTLSLYQNEAFKAHYIKEIMADSLGYAGTEIIRRIIGDSKVAEISEAPDGTQRVLMERHLLKFAEALILNRSEITTGKELLELYRVSAPLAQQNGG
ncbi:S-methyl-5-thioribose kinase [Enterococcus sp. BWM-S5]|uniref:S-methyl-5-thioribose kinase n=1 Tax=Enterococcus larvae TaxID=2794352 RepID=A0ABS4CIX6_9ENTE|nr:S-methyl-5-thioribose kinase [Enterococcus larvae]MBP1045970.1 S-methyl-5-thioribose kinase [Enterococcus larvae]